jgi:hypothetical protein
MSVHRLASWAIASSLLGTACAADSGAGFALGAHAEPLVHGTDDRTEYFDASAGARERLEQSAIALMPKYSLQGHRLSPDVLSSADADGLCPGERFADQPAAAFCSGVLVDWDLVLTAGHCVRALGLHDMAAVFGYYYAGTGELDIGEGDVFDVVEIVAEALDSQGVEPRLDYAFIRLSRPAGPPRRPAPISRHTLLQSGAPLVALDTPAGVPFKADSGARVEDPRSELLDYFTADTDTSHGSSGGGAFDDQLALVGVLARGGEDFVATAQGCLTTVSIPEPTPSEEQFSYATSALAALCESNPQSSLCRADCGDPCEPLAAPRTQGEPRALGCAVALRGKPRHWSCFLLASLSTLRRFRRRRAYGGRRRNPMM